MLGTIRIKILFVLIVFHLVSPKLVAQIIVTPAQTAYDLAKKITGQGVTVTNTTMNCPTQANGIFFTKNSIIGFDSGILLTNGRAATQGNAYGVNGPASYLASNDNGLPGDAMLNALSGQTTLDACSLEFDVIPNGDTIKFSYVFSSEEYTNAVCGPYNDVFGFFISGTGITGVENMALVPGTNIPVAINSINNGIPGAIGNIINCTNMGPGSPFTAFYIDNTTGATLTHKGLTRVLQAIHPVDACNVYHLKLVIADAGDPLYDSGVFLKARSLESGNFTIAAQPVMIHDSLATVCIKGCLPGRFNISSTQVSFLPQIIKYSVGGDAVAGVDYVPLPDSIIIPPNSNSVSISVHGLPTPVTGSRELKVYLMSPTTCFSGSKIMDSASISILDTLHISIQTPDTSVCINDIIHLLAFGPEWLNYSWSPTLGLSDPSSKSTFANIKSSIFYQLTATLPGTSCTANGGSIYISTKSTPQISLRTDTTVCFNQTFRLNAGTIDSSGIYQFSWTGPNGFSSSILNPLVSKVPFEGAGFYTITIINDTNHCRSSASINVQVVAPPEPTIATPQILCFSAEPVSLQAQGQDITWYNERGDSATIIAPIPNSSLIAAYKYFVTQTIENCESPKKEVDVSIKKCCDGTIQIPTAFSPNGDGKNDRFHVIDDYGYYIKQFTIFNRWGQVVYDDITGNWDGSFNGASAEVGTYFYLIKIGCIKGGSIDRVGDVVLLR